MFHLFHGKLSTHGNELYLENKDFGLLVEYGGDKKKGTRFLYPIIDPNRHTIKYYAFDQHKQKTSFLGLMKIQGIGGKHAYEIAMMDPKKLKEALKTFDIQFFTQISGIGPKTAKRILVELSADMGADDIQGLSIDKKLLKDILSSLHDLGYEKSAVKELLVTCPFALDKEYLPDIMKRLIDNL